MRDYVVGFPFSSDGKRTLLIEKQRPAWQVGFGNGDSQQRSQRCAQGQGASSQQSRVDEQALKPGGSQLGKDAGTDDQRRGEACWQSPY